MGPYTTTVHAESNRPATAAFDLGICSKTAMGVSVFEHRHFFENLICPLRHPCLFLSDQDRQNLIVGIQPALKQEKPYDALDWLAAMACHVPERRKRTIRHYGAYANSVRGRERKRQQVEPIPTVLEPVISSEAFRRNWARMIPFHWLGLQDLLGLDVLVKGEPFQSKPGHEIHHLRILPWEKRKLAGIRCGRKMRAFSLLSTSLILPTRIPLS